MAAKRVAQVDRRRCVSCGACVGECPRGALRVWRGCYRAKLLDYGDGLISQYGGA